MIATRTCGVSGTKKPGCRDDWVCVPGEQALYTFILFPDQVFPVWAGEAGRAGYSHVEALELRACMGSAVVGAEVTKLSWRERRVRRNGPIQLPCCFLCSAIEPHILGCFRARKKWNSAFKGTVTLRHLKYFSFLSVFFLKFLTLFEFNDSYYKLFMKMIF